MSTKRTVRIGPRPAAKVAGFDPRGTEVILVYVGPRTVRYAPARDLTGADLARVGYHRRFQEAIDTERPRPASDAGFADIAAIAAELVATGNWTLAGATTAPDAPADPPPTTEPDAPAEAPEV